MQIVDLHVHSKYAYACSKQLDLEQIELWCQIKGIDIVACADFTHPAWFKEISSKLKPQGNGLFKLDSPDISKAVRQDCDIKVNDPRDVSFVLGTEIACIYSQGGKARRIHLLIMFQKIEHIEQFQAVLTKRGIKYDYDGRPILGMSAQEVAAIVFDIDEQAMLIPAHAWTPWFAIFGSKSGFDSVEECFGEYAKYIYALETGLSSDPAMNWRLSQNDKYTLISNSDAHSLQNLGREANVLDLPEVSYQQLYDTIKEGDKERFKYTIEFFPEEGKYHLDGHRDCKFSCMPKETAKLKGRCKHCGKKITVGVHSRIEDLADHDLGRKPESYIPYKSIVPLAEIISDIVCVGKKSKKVTKIYTDIINQVGNEFQVLLNAEIDQIAAASTPLIAEAVKRVREGRVNVRGGYDGVFGEINIFSEAEKEDIGQKSLL